MDTCPICGSSVTEPPKPARRGFTTFCCAGCPWSFPTGTTIESDGWSFLPPEGLPFTKRARRRATVALLLDRFLTGYKIRGSGVPSDPANILPVEQVFLPAVQGRTDLLIIAGQIHQLSPSISKKIRALAETVGSREMVLIPGRGPDLSLETLSLATPEGFVVARATVCHGSRSAVQAHILPRKQVGGWAGGDAVAVVNHETWDGFSMEFAGTPMLGELSSHWVGTIRPAFLCSTDLRCKTHDTGDIPPLRHLTILPLSRQGLGPTFAPCLLPWAASHSLGDGSEAFFPGFAAEARAGSSRLALQSLLNAQKRLPRKLVAKLKILTQTTP